MSEIIFSYSRAQAIADGVLVDVTSSAKEAGFAVPVAVTRAVWERYVAVPTVCPWQDEQGRLWDVLVSLRFAAKAGRDMPAINFLVFVQNDRRGPRPAKLKALCHPGDTVNPVITILMPNED